MRMLPPISVPTPSGLPRIARRADSPPELPPGVSRVLAGEGSFRWRWTPFQRSSSPSASQFYSTTRRPDRAGASRASNHGRSHR